MNFLILGYISLKTSDYTDTANRTTNNGGFYSSYTRKFLDTIKILEYGDYYLN